MLWAGPGSDKHAPGCGVPCGQHGLASVIYHTRCSVASLVFLLLWLKTSVQH